jgi:hypothetical protein
VRSMATTRCLLAVGLVVGLSCSAGACSSGGGGDAGAGGDSGAPDAYTGTDAMGAATDSGSTDSGATDTGLADTGSKDAGSIDSGPSCTSSAGCATGEACNLTSGACGAACSSAEPCNGGCCYGGTCSTGTTQIACGTSGVCVSCIGKASGDACLSTGSCGCNVASDCPADAGVTCLPSGVCG